MKKYAIVRLRSLTAILLFAALFMACNEDKTIDVTVMPEETTVGAQTFGCLIDGWIYVGGRFSDEYHNLSADRFPSINFNKSNDVIKVKVKVEESGYIAFTINNIPSQSTNSASCTFTNAIFLQGFYATEGKDLGSGTVNITRYDTTEGIISGRFSGNIIKEGRFDVKYK